MSVLKLEATGELVLRGYAPPFRMSYRVDNLGASELTFVRERDGARVVVAPGKTANLAFELDDRWKCTAE